jgi:hypothetical protein
MPMTPQQFTPSAPNLSEKVIEFLKSKQEKPVKPQIEKSGLSCNSYALFTLDAKELIPVRFKNEFFKTKRQELFKTLGVLWKFVPKLVKD